jgi:PAS domain S-box-containing protein
MRLADRGPASKDSGRKWGRIAAKYASAVLAVALATVLRWWVVNSFGPMPLYITWYPAVLLVATIAGGGPGVVATLLSVLVADYYFIEPIGKLGIPAANDAVAAGIFIGMGIFLSVLATRLQRARRAEAISVAQEKELNLLNMGNLMTLDLDHRIVHWSEGNRRLYGFDAQEVQGQLSYKILRTHFDQSVEQIHSELTEKGHWEGEVTRWTKDGTQLSVAILWALRRDERGRPLAILEVSTDITRQKLAETSLRQQSEELTQQNDELSQQSEELAHQSEELSKQNEELQTQSEEIQALNTELGQREKVLQTLLDSARLPIGEEKVIEKICHATQEMVGPPATAVVVYEQHGDELQILARAGFDGGDTPASSPAKDSFVEVVMQQDRTACLEDTSLRPDLNYLGVPGHQPFAAVLASPLRIKGKPIGAVSIYSSKTQQWTKEQFSMIEWLAGKCSNAIEAMRLAAEVHQRQKQNEFLANIIEASSQAFGVGYPDGHLGLINKAFEQLTGYSSDELRSIDWAKTLTPPEWLELERQKLDELHHTDLPVRYEKEYIRKDGTRVPIDLLVRLVKDTDGKPLYYHSFITDITERKRVEKSLKDSEQQYRSLFNNLLHAFCHCKMIFDDGGRPVDYVYLEANKAFETMSGFTDVVGKKVTDVIPGVREAHPEMFEIYGRVAMTGKPEKFELHFSPTGLWFDVSAYSTKKGYVAIIFDNITVRKQAEELTGRLAAIVENADDAIISNDLNGIVQSWNLGAEKIFGYAAGEAVGRNISFLVPPGNVDEVPGSIKRILQGEHIENVESVRMHKDGTIVPVSLTVSPIKDAGGTIIGVSKIVQDMTDRKKAEAEVLKLSKDMAIRNLELESANREMETFIYSISHDLRAPIRAMSGFAKLINEDYAGNLDAQGQDYLGRILKGAVKSTQLIDDLLRLSKITRQEIDRIEVNLSKIALKAVEELREANHERDIDVVVQEGLSALVDPRLIEIAVSNLLGNAWKFTSNTENARIEFASTQKGGKTVYYVRDNGVGFDSTYANKMFLPFHRLHSEREFEGTGIGLAIVERVIQRHGGQVFAEGEVGKGATIYFTLG